MSVAPLHVPAESAPAPRNVLVFVHIRTHFTEMIRVAELLGAHSGDYRPIVLFAAMYEGVENDMARCRKSCIAYIIEPDLPKYAPQAVHPVRKRRAASPWRKKFGQALGYARHWLHGRAKGRMRRPLASFPGVMAGTRFSHALRATLYWCREIVAAPVRHAARILRIPLHRAQDVCRIAARRGRRVAQAIYLGARQFGPSMFSAACNAAKPPLRTILRMLSRPVPQALAQGGPATLSSRAIRLAVGLLGLMAYPLRPLLRVLATTAFGAVYWIVPEYLPADIKVHRALWRVMPHMMDAEQIGLVILPEDNFFYFTNLYVKAVHARGGIAVVVPFTIVNVLEWAEAFYREPSHDTGIAVNRLVAYLFPRWTHVHRGKTMVMPVQQVLCNAMFRTSPPVPWLINSGHADAIAVESRFMMSYYRQSGIAASRLVFTGALYDDVLHHARNEAVQRRSALYASLALPPGRPMLLCALPPDQLRGAGRAQCEFNQYSELLEQFVAPLRQLADSFNIVISLHPRTTQTDVAGLDLGRIVISREDVASLIPLCELYVASSSATIRLAINCGIPVVNYDVYVYDYNDYKGVPGVVAVTRGTAYEKTIMRLGTVRQDLADLANAQLRFASEQAQVDGMAGQRLLQLLGHLVGPNTGIAT